MSGPQGWGPLFLFYVVTERGKSQPGQFEMLQSEGDSDDRDAEQYPETDVREEYPDAPDEEPDDVHQEGQATIALGYIDYFAAEGPQGENS